MPAMQIRLVTTMYTLCNSRTLLSACQCYHFDSRCDRGDGPSTERIVPSRRASRLFLKYSSNALLRSRSQAVVCYVNFCHVRNMRLSNTHPVYSHSLPNTHSLSGFVNIFIAIHILSQQIGLLAAFKFVALTRSHIIVLVYSRIHSSYSFSFATTALSPVSITPRCYIPRSTLATSIL